METVQTFATQALEFMQGGFYNVNGPQGLIIALLAVVIMKNWGQWMTLTLGATIVYAVVEAVRPIIFGKGELKLPPVVEPNYWLSVAGLFVGLAIIIAMFFAVKSVFFLRGGGAKAKAH
jgi:hypothetical protein